MTCDHLLHIEIYHHRSWYTLNISCPVKLIRLLRYITSSLAKTFNDAMNGIFHVLHFIPASHREYG